MTGRLGPSAGQKGCLALGVGAINPEMHYEST